MEQKLDFSLPEKKKKGNAAGWLSVVLLLIVAAMMTANLYIVSSRRTSPTEMPRQALSADQAKELAAKLARRNLYHRAAAVWKDYLSAGAPAPGEQARTLFQIALSLEKAGRYDEAVENYYRSEAAAKLDDLQPQISAHIADCLEKLGRFSALRQELVDRTHFKKSSDTAGKVVAEIGAEKITEADLDAVIEQNIDNRLSSIRAFMTAEQLNEQKKKLLDQYKNPQARLQVLQAWVTQEVLYRNALEQKLPEQPDVKQLIDEQMRGILAQHLMNQQLGANIHVTESDLQTYYNANKQNYMEPEKARISHIIVDDQKQANDLMGRIKAGEDFAALAKQLSKDETTRPNAGKIDADVVKGPDIPGIGSFAELNGKIFAAQAPALLDPFRTDKGWEIVKVDQKLPERQKTFEEVRQDVISELLRQKREDVQDGFIKQMMDKYNVIIHTSAVTGKTDGQADKPAATK
jgi:parvulin-like peptidyl-prolyl isomerase